MRQGYVSSAITSSFNFVRTALSSYNSRMRLLKIFGVAWFRFVQFGFYLLYNPLAWAYDGVSFLVSQGDWRRWTQGALPHVHGPGVLEIGCGPGHLLGGPAAGGCQVAG